MEIKNTKDLAQAYKQGPYAWPGGYPVYLMFKDGEACCWECFKKEYGNIADAIDDSHNPWRPMDTFVNWEDTELYCANCNKSLESAYGDQIRSMKCE